MRIHYYIVLWILLLVLSGGCVSSSVQPPNNTGLTKRINEILDEIKKDPYSKRFLAYPTARLFASTVEVYDNIIAGKTEVVLLIEHSDISLPLMFKRIEKLPPNSPSLILYFIVFEHTKSAESIPDIANYFASWNDEQEINQGLVSIPAYALMAAQGITHPLNFTDKNRSHYDQRLDIAKKLRQWYEEYKRYHK